jgi:hypothetical protein
MNSLPPSPGPLSFLEPVHEPTSPPPPHRLFRLAFKNSQGAHLPRGGSLLLVARSALRREKRREFHEMVWLITKREEGWTGEGGVTDKGRNKKTRIRKPHPSLSLDSEGKGSCGGGEGLRAKETIAELGIDIFCFGQKCAWHSRGS